MDREQEFTKIARGIRESAVGGQVTVRRFPAGKAATRSDGAEGAPMRIVPVEQVIEEARQSFLEMN